MLKLRKFRVTNFRSVKDSGWIEADDVTALIGTNESGKTNLLVPLWKLNPAKDGKIDPIADYPRASYNKLRTSDAETPFIRAEFICDEELKAWLVATTGQPKERLETVIVTRYFDGLYTLRFPGAEASRYVGKSVVHTLLHETAHAVEPERTIKKEQPLQAAMLAALSEERTSLSKLEAQQLDHEALSAILNRLNALSLAEAGQHSANVAHWSNMTAQLQALAAEIAPVDPQDVDGVFERVIAEMPKFVYYSNYGNLDSEIYLPHVIANMKRTELGAKEEAKARTLRVLFDFVRLSPEEILKLGKAAAPSDPNTKITAAEIADAAARTKQRDILLRSADTDLTKSFRAWWKQGDYRFRFSADGDHFRIWVSDDRRPEEIELESRSTGLQWFFSFFLVFLVERGDAHKGAVLLLDEPGLSLHPLSQRDLSMFFENLSKTNPIIYTTHSPFMVDQDHVDRVRVVYVDDDGATAVSSDLRASSARAAESKSVYAVHAALGLSVSDALLQGCATVVVEGSSDQFYLTAAKTALIAKQRLAPRRELLFVPAGGAKGVNTIVPIVTAKDESPPVVLLDDDGQGRQFAEALRDGPIYKGLAERVVSVRDITGLEFSEVEDLMGPYVVDAAGRMFRGPDDDFRDAYVMGSPVVPQIQAYAAKHNIKLVQGWKVDLARAVKQRVLRELDRIPEETLKLWGALFARFDPPAAPAS